MGIIKKWREFSKKSDNDYKAFTEEFARCTEEDKELQHIYKLAEDKNEWRRFITQAFERWSGGYDLGSVISCELMKRKL